MALRYFAREKECPSRYLRELKSGIGENPVDLLDTRVADRGRTSRA
jgi:hypothetical protein